MNKAKPFCISKRAVWEAYHEVRANQGAAGVDGQTIRHFAGSLKDNLYKLWNRMSSGSYVPPAVRQVKIPKRGGGQRTLGIPTVSDRIAQTVVKRCLEPHLEPKFHHDSYGYRPSKSAVQAVGVARRRCWRYDWVLDLDIKGFFDNLDHELLLRALRKHTSSKWILLYVERWLKAPLQREDGTLEERVRGTPQGGVISPLLANLFLHYAFDKWMQREYPSVPFERYADDVIAHCRTERQARELKRAIELRFRQCKLELHPQKTQIVYCKDDERRGSYLHQKFDFLGFTFRPRQSRTRWGKTFVNFSPAVSSQAVCKMRRQLRSLRLHLQTRRSLDDLARQVNPFMRGWINYYGSFHRSALYVVFQPFNRILLRWVCGKYKRFKRRKRRAGAWLYRIQRHESSLFACWQLSRSCNGRTVRAG